MDSWQIVRRFVVFVVWCAVLPVARAQVVTGASGSIQQVLGQCPAAGPCSVTVDPGYAGTEALPALRLNFASVTDRRFGRVTTVFHNWRSDDTKVGARTELCLDDAVPDGATIAPGDFGAWMRQCRFTSFVSTSPGFNPGSGDHLPRGFGPRGWQIATGDALSMRVYGAGIKGARDFSLECYGVGDCHDYGYIQGTAGCTDLSCEGFELLARGGGEVDSNFAGPVAMGGQNATRVRIDCKSGCDTQGTGRYLIEENAAFPSNGAMPAMKSYVAASPAGGYVLTLDPTVPLPAAMISTAWGATLGEALVPQLLENAATLVTLRVRVNSAAGKVFRKGYLVAIGGNFHELAVVAEASAATAGVQEIKVTLRHSHPAGAPVFQGQDNGTAAVSATGMALRFVANDIGPLKYVFDVLGATDAAHLVVAQYRAGGSAQGFDLGNVYNNTTGVARPLRRSAGKVLMVVPGLTNNMALVGQREITIAGSDHFSGICKDAKIADLDNSLMTCMQPGPDGVDKEFREVTLAVGDTPFGNTRFTLHRMAEVLDVRNPQTMALDGSLTLEPNEGAWLPGTLAQLTHHTSQVFIVGMLNETVHDPYNSEINAGINLGFNGESNFGGVGASRGMIALHLTNNTEANRYSGAGGTRVPMRATQLNGLWESNLLMVTAPFPNGSTADFIGCPLSGCDDATYAWSPRALAGKGGGYRETWSPAKDLLRTAVTGAGKYSEWTQTPVGFRFSAPITVDGALVAGGTDNAFELRLAAGATSVTYTTHGQYGAHPICARPQVLGEPGAEAALGGVGATWSGAAGLAWTLTLRTGAAAAADTLLDVVCFPRE